MAGIASRQTDTRRIRGGVHILEYRTNLRRSATEQEAQRKKKEINTAPSWITGSNRSLSLLRGLTARVACDGQIWRIQRFPHRSLATQNTTYNTLPYGV